MKMITTPIRNQAQRRLARRRVGALAQFDMQLRATHDIIDQIKSLQAETSVLQEETANDLKEIRSALELN